MAWRVLVGGPMLEIVNGIDPANPQRELTSIQIGAAGQVIEKPLSRSMRERYESNDPYMRSIVEYGEVSVDEESGEKVFTAQGGSTSPVGSSGDDSAQVAALNERISELETQLADAQKAQPVDYASLSVEALEAEATKRGVYPEKGSGANDNVVKVDLVKALQEADAKNS